MFTFCSMKIFEATEKLEDGARTTLNRLESAINILHFYHIFNQLAIHQPIF